MTSLLGAWSMSGEDVSQILEADTRREMLAQLPEPGRAHCHGSLWLAGVPENLHVEPSRCIAYEGYMPSMNNLPDIGAIPSTDLIHALPQGEYVLAMSDSSQLNLMRSLSGGERLYYLEHRGLLVFASSVRPLLVLLKSRRRFNVKKRQEIVLTGLTLFGNDTLFEGIQEILAGHVVTFSGAGRTQRFFGEPLLRPLTGEPGTLAREFREALTAAVRLAIGDRTQVAVALSGDIDSAAVIAAATDVVGAANVVAFTHVFDDPTHNDETPFAREVCRSLGIQRHEVYKITLDAFLKAIPETVWRAESFVHWPKAFLLPASRHIRDQGFDQYLTGFGIGSHMTFFHELVNLIHHCPAPRLLFKAWELAQYRNMSGLMSLESVHPGLAIPNRRLYYLLLTTMKAQGLIDRLSDYYPQEYHGLLASEPSVDSHFSELTPEALLRMQSFSHLISCVDVTRWDKPLREIGVQRVSPAHFSSCLPYAYLHYLPQPFLWSRNRHLRPGKHLLRVAMQGILPDSVLYRKKSWDDAVISQSWFRAGIRWMDRVASDAGMLFDQHDPAIIDRWDRRSPQAAITGLRFWHKIFVEGEPSMTAPTWASLYG